MTETVRKELLAKQYLQNTVLKGYPVYQRELRQFSVRFVDDPRCTAAVDPKAGIIYLNSTVMDNPDPKLLGMLIRHELLHVFLNHLNRELIMLAKELGYDPFHLTSEQLDQVWKAKSEAVADQYTGLNANSRGNIAGDIDLARYYLDDDKSCVRTLGGLLMDDRPAWVKLSYEQIWQALKEEAIELKQRATKIINGTYDEATGVFTPDDPNDQGKSEFDTDIIDPKDILGVTWLTYDDLSNKCFDTVSLTAEVALVDRPAASSLIVQNFSSYPSHFEDIFDPTAWSHKSAIVVQIRAANYYAGGLSQGDRVYMRVHGKNIPGYVLQVHSLYARVFLDYEFPVQVDTALYKSAPREYRIADDPVAQKSLKTIYEILMKG